MVAIYDHLGFLFSRKLKEEIAGKAVPVARDAGKHEAMAPRECQLALVRPTFMNQLRVTLQHVHHLQGAVSRLCCQAPMCLSPESMSP